MHERFFRPPRAHTSPRTTAIALIAASACLTMATTACQNDGDVAITSPTGSVTTPSTGAPGSTDGTDPTTPTSHDRIIATGWVRKTANGNSVALDVLSLGRVNAHVVALKLRVTDVSEEGNCSCDDVWSDVDFGSPWGDLMLIDGTGMKVYHPLTKTSDDEVAQTGFGSGIDNMLMMKPGESFVSTILYPAPPAAVRHIDIESGATDPIENVPIGNHYTLGPGDPHPNQKMNPPIINPLIEHSVAQDDSGTVDTKGNKTTVQVRSDVLFAFNKATLTDRADAVLKRVAQQIDAAKARTIHIDGYTDNQGTDARNQPLSRHRADAVEKKLTSMVTLPGITWVSRGHGAKHPVADNDSKAGRAKNRRVTVTIDQGAS